MPVIAAIPGRDVHLHLPRAGSNLLKVSATHSKTVRAIRHMASPVPLYPTEDKFTTLDNLIYNASFQTYTLRERGLSLVDPLMATILLMNISIGIYYL